jgi:hypothetical protein
VILLRTKYVYSGKNVQTIALHRSLLRSGKALACCSLEVMILCHRQLIPARHVRDILSSVSGVLSF